MEKVTKKLFLAAVFSYLLVFFYFFFTGSLFYFGEAVSYEGVLRLIQGLPFASLPNAVPVSLTPYSPLFVLPLFSFSKLMGASSVESVMLLARLSQAVWLGLLFSSLNHLRKHFFPHLSDSMSFMAACGLVFFYKPVMELALRPDTLSFLCEAWAIFWIISFLKSNRDRCLLLASFFFSSALALKLNTLGGLFGTLGFFFLRREWKSFAKLAFLTLALGSFFLFLHQWFLGEAFSQNILISIQSKLWNPQEALGVYKKLFDLFLLPLSPFLLFVLLGIQSMEDRLQSSLFKMVLLSSFALAFLSQLKWGAYHNYFLGTLYFGIIPASFGIFHLSKHYRKVVYGFISTLILIFMVQELSIPAKIWLDKRYFFELARLQELVKEKAPNGFLYSTDEKIKVGFVGKMALGVLTEELLSTTPKFQPLIPQIKTAVEQAGGYQAFINPCFSPPEGKWEKTQTGYYCLYTHAYP